VREKVEELLRSKLEEETIKLPGGKEMPNICTFYEQNLKKLLHLKNDSCYFSYIHGDLNGANIIIDKRYNVWLIDFFHTHRGHILKDLIKLENDLLYIYTKVENQEDFDLALHLSDLLLDQEDLAELLMDFQKTGLRGKQFERAWKTIQFLHGFYPKLIQNNRNPLQWYIGHMRYAVHTLSFDESNLWQKKMGPLYGISLC